MDYMVMTFLLLFVGCILVRAGRRLQDGLGARLFIIVGKVSLGAVVLVVVNLLGEQVGVIVPVNPVCSAVAGFLGAPGVVLLITLRLMLG